MEENNPTDVLYDESEVTVSTVTVFFCQKEGGVTKEAAVSDHLYSSGELFASSDQVTDEFTEVTELQSQPFSSDGTLFRPQANCTPIPLQVPLEADFLNIISLVRVVLHQPIVYAN